MNTLYKFLPLVFLLSFACGSENSTLTEKKTALTELKSKLKSTQEEIKVLEKEILNS